MRFVLLTAGLFCSGMEAFALLGDTRAVADERYGVAHLESPAIREEPLVEGAHHAIYHFEGFEIYCAFLKATDGQSYCVRERYERLRASATAAQEPKDLLVKGNEAGSQPAYVVSRLTDFLLITSSNHAEGLISEELSHRCEDLLCVTEGRKQREWRLT